MDTIKYGKISCSERPIYFGEIFLEVV